MRPDLGGFEIVVAQFGDRRGLAALRLGARGVGALRDFREHS
jgi:hypothetical protein